MLLTNQSSILCANEKGQYRRATHAVLVIVLGQRARAKEVGPGGRSRDGMSSS